MILDAGIEVERRHLCPSAHHLKDHDLTRRTFPWAVLLVKCFKSRASADIGVFQQNITPRWKALTYNLYLRWLSGLRPAVSFSKNSLTRVLRTAFYVALISESAPQFDELAILPRLRPLYTVVRAMVGVPLGQSEREEDRTLSRARFRQR
jgi:hypothetical protein